MPSAALVEIEDRLPLLSEEEQRSLLERLGKQLQESDDEPASFKESLEAMARDPQIQAEIKAINEEFACTDMDGLGDNCIRLGVNSQRRTHAC